mgnify:CR=1 FL=1
MVRFPGSGFAFRSTLAVMLVALLVHSCGGASALERVDGDFWRYHVTIDLASLDLSELNVSEIPSSFSGIEVAGTVTYEYLGPDNVTVGGSANSVNVMAVSGDLVGSVDLIGLSVSAAIQGHIFESSEGQGTVKDDLTMWTNLTWGVGSFAYLKRYEARVINLYSPPLMDGFDPESVVLGQSWDETTEVRTIGMNVTTGAVVSDTNDSVEVHFAVASETEEVSVPAGEFTAYMVTASEAGGSTVVYWWSEKAANFVKQETYFDNDTEPAETMVLEDYGKSSRTSILVYVSVGVIVLAVAMVALGLVLLKRRPRREEPKPPPELLQLPPT